MEYWDNVKFFEEILQLLEILETWQVLQKVLC